MHVTGRGTHRVSPARQTAFSVLEAVDRAAFASDTLRELAGGLAARDAGLASQLVFGTLRVRLQLDYLIQRYSGKPVSQLDGNIANILRLGIFQLRYLDRIPSHAAVDEAVELAKMHRRAASGLVNAVLRKVNRQPVSWPDRATQFSCPAWLLARWDAHFGRERADGIAEAALLEPESYIRIPSGEILPELLDLEPVADVPGAYRIRSGPADGLRLHDVGSQAVLPLLGLAAGDRYLDLCSAPGNKTRQALETPLAFAIACDVSERRLTMVDAPIRVVLDGTQPLPFPPATFSRVFIDAPCSGTGTIGRNPEIKWRVQTGDFCQFGEKQQQLVLQALTVLTPGGKLLYATCSLEREENEAVIAELCAKHKNLWVEEERWRLPGVEAGDGFYAAVLRWG